MTAILMAPVCTICQQGAPASRDIATVALCFDCTFVLAFSRLTKVPWYGFSCSSRRFSPCFDANAKAIKPNKNFFNLEWVPKCTSLTHLLLYGHFGAKEVLRDGISARNSGQCRNLYLR